MTDCHKSKAWWELQFNQWDAQTSVWQHVRDAVTHSPAHRPPLPVGSLPGANCDPDTRVQRSKSFVFPGLPLIIYSWESRETRREKERNLPARSLWCGKAESSFSSVHPELVPGLLSVFFFFLLTSPACSPVCVCAHMVSVTSTCVSDGRRRR